MSAWTPEPWQKLKPDCIVRWVELPLNDYRRAVACVEALAGVQDPANELGRLRACEQHLRNIMRLCLRQSDADALTVEYLKAEETLNCHP